MKKIIFRGIPILLLAIVLTFGAVAADSPFGKTKSYTAGEFGDLSENAWYYNEVISAYELGLMSGMGGSTFAPDGTLTVAQGITLAARIHSLYHGGTGLFEQGEPWYQVYLDYASENGFLTSGQFDSYSREIKRYEMATLIASALPADYYTAINSVSSIPDVSANAPYKDAVMLLYHAGIVMGNDAYGTFSPNASIKRSEVSAIINRVAIPANRLKKTLLDAPASTTLAPVYLIDDQGMPTALSYGQLGWDFDNRGGISGATTYAINDISDKARVALVRKITEQKNGTLTLETAFSPSAAANGFYLWLGDGESAAASKLITKNGYYYMEQDGKLVETGVAVQKKLTFVKMITNLDAKTNQLSIDGTYIGEYGFSEACTKINNFMYASTDEDIVYAAPKYTKLYANYALNDQFISAPEGALPNNWWLSDNSGVTAAITNNNASKYDDYGLTLNAPAGSHAKLVSTFAPISDKVCFEMKFLMKDPINGTTFSLKSGDTTVFQFVTKDSTICDTDGKILRSFSPNVWQTLRVEANVKTGKAVLKIDMKKVEELDFSATSFDGVEVAVNSDKDAKLLVDDFYVYNMFDETENYVPTPVPVKTKGYYVGVEVCDIWRNGFQFGWDYVSPFEEITPYLGYFDEGSTEVADWEIKWMAEHGIDFRLVCWYSGGGSSPVKTPRNAFGQNDGYMNAKYSDMTKFAIMWEDSGNLPKNSEEFRNYIVPYWVEYYLTDDRYMVIDNKPVITIYRNSTMIDMFGSVEGARAEVDYLRQVCKNLGYDDAIILTSSGTSDETELKKIKAMGFDGVYAYNWGKTADIPQNQINAINGQNNKGIVDTIPTVAVGFNDVPLHDTRSTNISVDNYVKMLTWVRDEFLPKRDASSWKSKMLILSNWNEFGEGHYLMPSTLNGFGYLDSIRKVFTENPDHTDVAPTAVEREHFNSLFLQSRKVIRRLRWEEEKQDTSNLQSFSGWDFSKATDRAQWKNFFSVANYMENAASISGSSEQSNFAIIMKDKVSIPLEGIDFIHIRMKNTLTTDTASKGEVFFITATDTTYEDKKHVLFNLTSDGEYHDYYMDMSAISGWKGILTQIRIDPMMSPGTFDISLIELMKKPDSEKVFINGQEKTFDFTPKFDQGQLIVSINPPTGILASMGIYHIWDYDTKTLTMKANGHSVTMSMGNATAIVDGAEKAIGTTPYLRDGLPMISLDFLVQNLGFTLDKEGMNFKITAVSSDYTEAMKNRKNYEWEFNIPGDTEGWKYASALLDSSDGGALNFTSQSNGKRHDPALTSPDFVLNAADYNKVVVRMKHELAEVDTASATIFFRTEGGAYDGKKTVAVPVESKSSDGEYVEYVFDMTQNPDWKGNIIGIRFDPFDAVGTFSIDSIKLIKNS